MINLGSWMNGILIGWGVDPKIANTFDEMIIAALLVILAIGLDYLCQAIFVGSMKKLAQHTHYQWDSLLLKRKVVHHLVHTIPGILVYALLPLAFIRGKGLLLLSQKICAVYIVFALLLAINGFILVFLDMYNMRQVNKNRPIKGFMQVLQVLLFFIGGIVMGNVGIPFDGIEQFDTVHYRHHNIADDEARLGREYFIESFFPVLSRGYIVLVLQDIFDKMAQLGVVFHDQYRFFVR